MGVLSAMANAIASIADVANPKGVVVFVSRSAPESIPSNESLALWGRVRGAVDAGFQPVVVFDREPSIGARSAVTHAITQMATDANGRSFVVTRQANENIYQAIARAGAGLRLPVAGVVVGFPPAVKGFEREENQLTPAGLRKFFRRSDLAVVADYFDAKLRTNDRYADKGDYVSGLELDSRELLQYSSVTVPNMELARKVTAAAKAHLNTTDGFAFRDAYPLLTNDDNLRIAVSPIPKTRFVTHDMAPEIRQDLSTSLVDALGINDESNAFEYAMPGIGLGRELSQSDYGLTS